MSPLAGRRILRMNGAGNKILVFDLRGGATPPTAEEARAINRAKSLDYDQMMVLSDPHSQDALAYVLIYNNDGTLAGACGNGTRCVADFFAQKTGLDTFYVETQAGKIACERLGPTAYRVDMGAPKFCWRDIPLAHEVADTAAVDVRLDGDVRLAGAADFGPASVVNMGNPHVIFFVADVANTPVEKLGPGYETDPLFPEKTNVSFAQILSPDRIRLRVWERGVGVTLACGSAACAALVAASRRGLTGRRAEIDLPGGQLVIEWRDSDGHVLMTGPVEFEREITLDASIFST